MVILVSGFSFKRVAYILTLKANKSKGNTVLTTIFEEREEGKKRKEGRKEGRKEEGRKEGRKDGRLQHTGGSISNVRSI